MITFSKKVSLLAFLALAFAAELIIKLLSIVNYFSLRLALTLDFKLFLTSIFLLIFGDTEEEMSVLRGSLLFKLKSEILLISLLMIFSISSWF